MPKKSKYQQVYEHLSRPEPECYKEVWEEWVNDFSPPYPGSFYLWLLNKTKGEGNDQDN